VQVVQGGDDLKEDVAAFGFVHGGTHFNIVKEVHAGETVRDHFDVVVYVVFEKIGHLEDVRVTEAILTEVVKDVDFQRDGAKSTVSSPGVNEDSTFSDILENDLLAVSGVPC